MANDEKKIYPQMPVKHWWSIREKFKTSIPTSVTDSYLASVLDIQKASAQSNILPTLKQIGLIGEDGKTLEIAKKWRDDQNYPSVCKDLINHIYPKELIDAFSDPISERKGVYRWFSMHTGTGDVAVNKMVAFYLLLVEADPAKIIVSKPNGSKKTPSKAKPINKKQISSDENISSEKEIPINKLLNNNSKKDVIININIQLTVPETTNEVVYQKFFEAMNKYLLS